MFSAVLILTMPAADPGPQFVVTNKCVPQTYSVADKTGPRVMAGCQCGPYCGCNSQYSCGCFQVRSDGPQPQKVSSVVNRPQVFGYGPFDPVDPFRYQVSPVTGGSCANGQCQPQQILPARGFGRWR